MGLNPVLIWQDNCFMCIERNRDILFGRGGEKLRLTVTSATAAAMQLVLPNPTTLAIPATAGLVHLLLTLVGAIMHDVQATGFDLRLS
jgi:hypothetical protein